MCVDVVVVVIKLPQTLEHDDQKHLSCMWRADELITVCAWVKLVMAMVGGVGGCDGGGGW